HMIEIIDRDKNIMFLNNNKENKISDGEEALRTYDRNRKRQRKAKETQDEREARLSHRRNLYHQNKVGKTVKQQIELEETSNICERQTASTQNVLDRHED
ncbi:12955_t:CDS:1, partial [Acaulospora morrowiae]